MWVVAAKNLSPMLRSFFHVYRKISSSCDPSFRQTFVPRFFCLLADPELVSFPSRHLELIYKEDWITTLQGKANFQSVKSEHNALTSARWHNSGYRRMIADMSNWILECKAYM